MATALESVVVTADALGPTGQRLVRVGSVVGLTDPAPAAGSNLLCEDGRSFRVSGEPGTLATTFGLVDLGNSSAYARPDAVLSIETEIVASTFPNPNQLERVRVKLRGGASLFSTLSLAAAETALEI